MATKEGDTILFHHEGGINVGDVDSKAARLEVPIGTFPNAEEIEKKLFAKVPADRKAHVAAFHRSIIQILCRSELHLFRNKPDCCDKGFSCSCGPCSQTRQYCRV